ncbi:MAG TPA: response regulator [Sphingomonas sp.]
MERLRVLIIDDSLTIRALVEELVMRDRDFGKVAVAADVGQALSMMEALRPHVITLDLAMPGLGGLDFLDLLRDRAHAPIIVVSSATQAGAAAREEALARGADHCFDKGTLISEAQHFLRLLKRAARRKVAKNGHDYQAAYLSAGAKTD